METWEVTLPRERTERRSPRAHLAGQTEGRYLVCPAGLGKRKSHLCLDWGPHPGVVSPDDGNEYHQAPPTSRQSNIPFQEAQGPKH